VLDDVLPVVVPPIDPMGEMRSGSSSCRGRNINFGVVEQCQLDLLADGVNVGLPKQQIGPPAASGRTAPASRTVRSVPPSLVGISRVSFWERYAGARPEHRHPGRGKRIGGVSGAPIGIDIAGIVN
jgi:hypothetical protein